MSDALGRHGGTADLAGKVAVVTGAGGRAGARRGGGAGRGRRRAVVVNDWRPSDVVDEIEALGGKALFVAGRHR